MIKSVLLSGTLYKLICSWQSYLCVAHGDRFSEVGAQQIPSGLPNQPAPQRFEDSWSYYQSNDLNASRVRTASGLAPISSKATKARVK